MGSSADSYLEITPAASAPIINMTIMTSRSVNPPRPRPGLPFGSASLLFCGRQMPRYCSMVTVRFSGLRFPGAAVRFRVAGRSGRTLLIYS